MCFSIASLASFCFELILSCVRAWGGSAGDPVECLVLHRRQHNNRRTEKKKKRKERERREGGGHPYLVVVST